MRRLAVGGFAAALLCAGGFELAVRTVPFPEETFTRIPADTLLADRDGTLLRILLRTDDQDCRPDYRPAREDWIAQAIVAAEDRRFWTHPGVDVRAIARALIQNAVCRRRVSGASTLTTQVIRLTEPRPRTVRTKLMEALRARQLERRYSKMDILAQYLNRAPFGGNVIGIEAAARRYFGKRAKDLSLAEAALLAGVPQSPSRGRPDRHPDRAKRRQLYVLDRMQACGMISPEAADTARNEAIAARREANPFDAPHFCDWIGAPAFSLRDGTQRTTLDSRLQRRAEDLLRRRTRETGAGGAVVLIEVATGAIRAMVGSPNYHAADAGQVNAALAPRAAGSTLKPFAYALALDRGELTPQTILPDAPVRYRDLEPENFDSTFLGRVTVRDALALSLNLPAVDVQRRIGQPRLVETLRRLGLHTLSRPADHYGTGLVLGNGEVRLLDLANAYACLARSGRFWPVRAFEAQPPGDGPALFSPEACWLIADMLSGDERAMDLGGHTADAQLPRMAWKTGTSAGLRDAWAVAWNPEWVVGVWVGYPDGHGSDALVGRVAATPIAWDLFRSLYPDNRGPWFERPAGVVRRDVCAVSGLPMTSECRTPVEDWAIARVTRRTPCPLHDHQKALAGREAAPEPGMVKAALRIVTPANGSAYRWLPDADATTQRLALNAESESPGEPLFWFVNDRPLGASPAGQPVFWPIAPGVHRIVCCTASGAEALAKITVR